MNDDTRRPRVDATRPPAGRELPAAPEWVARTAEQDPLCRHVLAALVQLGDDYGRGQVSLRAIARTAGTTTRTLRTHLPHLLAARLVMANTPPVGPTHDVPMTYWLASPLPPVPGGGR